MFFLVTLNRGARSASPELANPAVCAAYAQPLPSTQPRLHATIPPNGSILSHMATHAASQSGRTGGSLRAERRDSDRIKVKGLWCDRGQVLDLSERGMRLNTLRRWSEGFSRTITIVDGPDRATVEARVVWCRQIGSFSHLVGLAFIEPTPAAAQALRRIAERQQTVA